MKVLEGDEPVEVEPEDGGSPLPKKKQTAEVVKDPWRDFVNNSELVEFIVGSAEKVESKSYKVDDELTEAEEGAKKQVGVKADYFANVVVEDDKAPTQNLIQTRDKAFQALRIFVARRMISTLLIESPEALRTYIVSNIGVDEEKTLRELQHYLKLLGNEAVFQKVV